MRQRGTKRDLDRAQPTTRGGHEAWSPTEATNQVVVILGKTCDWIELAGSCQPLKASS